LEKTYRHRPGQPGRGRCLKGEERVCHVTEADRLGPQGLGVSEEVSSCEAAWCGGFAPVRGGFVRRNKCSAGDQAQVRASGGCLGTERR
jgi:hypothetical protein